MKNSSKTFSGRLINRLYFIAFLLLTGLSGFSQNVGINSTGAVPNAAAGLDVDFTDRGVLVPRVALTNTASFAPLSAHVAGMVVYNTATAGNVTPGFYYNDGTRWVPSFPSGTAIGNMLYWSGTAWVTIPVGSTGQYLQLNGSQIPTWAGAANNAILSTTAASAISDVLATSGGNITSDGGSPIFQRGICWKTATGPTIGDNKTIDGTGTGIFTSSLTGLTQATTYYVRAYAINSTTITYGNEISFTTNTPTLPVLDATTAATSITVNSATSGGNLTDNGNATITARGICYSTTNPPTIADTKIVDPGTGLGSYSANLTGLTSNTLYYVRSYATNSIGTGYGAVANFTTLPIITSTTAASVITTTGATTGGTITVGGGATITARGVCWSGTANPTIADSKTTDGTGTGTFVSTISGLAYTTTYHVRAYATNAGGTVYGNDITFTTLTPVGPTVTTTAASSVTGSGAASGGNVTNTGGAPIIERGIVYSLSANPTVLTGTKIIDGAPGSGSFTSNLTGLAGGTTYHVKAYAINSFIATPSYGSEITFTTAVTPPTLVTVAASGISGASAISGGSMSWNGAGYQNYQYYGVAYSTTPVPAPPVNIVLQSSYLRFETNATNGSVNIANPIGPWVTNLTGLAPNTTYYIRSYLNLWVISSSSWVTVYGPEINFTTTAATAPVMSSTTAISLLTSSSALSGGQITSNGGSAITAKGVVWGTTSNPVLGPTNFTSNGTGSGGYSSNITGLSGNTLYYVRAYATNGVGTSYGPQLTFTTYVTPRYNIGDAVEGGIVFYVNSQGGGLIGSTVDQSAGSVWGCYNLGGIGTTAAIGDGSANTTSILAGCLARPIAASVAKAYAGGGYNDWYLPSADELGQMFNQYSIMSLPVGISYWSSTDGGSGSAATSYYLSAGTPQRTTALKNGSYRVRAIRSFSPPSLPAVTTVSVTGIGNTTATGGGNVTNTGGATISAGVCWSTTSGPTIANAHTTGDATAVGAYTSNITGLLPNTLYYVKAYVTNFQGTAYGSEVSFTTLASALLPTIATNDPVTNISYTTATAGGNITNEGASAVIYRGVCWSTTSPATLDLVNNNNYSQAVGTGTGSFSDGVFGLTPGTLYYVRAYATNGSGTAYSANEISFTTAAYTAPTVTTAIITNLAATTATSGGNVTSNGGDPTTTHGVCWSLTADPTVGGNQTNDGTGTGVFASSITSLSPSTTYHVRAYATNSVTTSYGSDVSFTTGAVSAPIMGTTDAVITITGSTGISGGTITSDGGSSITAFGLCFGTSTAPELATSASTTAGSWYVGSFVSLMNGLSSGTVYYVRAYATNAVGTTYSATEQTFTTATTPVPTVTTTPITNILGTSATSGGNVTNDGGEQLWSRGICWGINPNPTTLDNALFDNGNTVGSYVGTMTGLITGTLYYMRAFAENSAGFGYGTELTFTPTGTAAIPDVTTDALSNQTSTGVSCDGTIVSDGGSAITASGVVWGTSYPPTFSNSSFTTDGTATGTFTSNITGLSPGIYYYIRAYATNVNGTAYGATIQSYCPNGTPTLNTLPLIISNPFDNTATSGLMMTNFGNSSFTLSASGVCWGTGNTSPDIATHLGITNDGVSNQATSTLTGLVSGTTYRVRAYATNSDGFTGYGQEIIFTPGGAAGAAMVNTEPVFDKIGSVAISGGSILSDGGSPVTASGIVWGTSVNPTIVSNLGITHEDWISGTYSSVLSGLTVNGVYHVRAYATNGVTTAYGADVTFTATAATVGQSLTGNNPDYIGYVYSVDGTGAHGFITNGGYSFNDWGCTGTNVGTTLSGGYANTDAIIASNAAGSCVSTAIPWPAFAADFTKNYFPSMNWYLPSKDEFTVLWTNAIAAGINYTINLTPGNGPYWSSSEVDGTVGTAVWYFDGTTWVNTGLKNSLKKVVAIRSF